MKADRALTALCPRSTIPALQHLHNGMNRVESGTEDSATDAVEGVDLEDMEPLEREVDDRV